MLQCLVAAVVGCSLQRKRAGASACHAVYQTVSFCKILRKSLLLLRLILQQLNKVDPLAFALAYNVVVLLV